MKTAFILLASLIAITGCVSYGRKIDQVKVEQIKPGLTTKAQVVQLIGSPDQISSFNNTLTFSYHFIRATPKAANFVPVVNIFAGGANVQNESVIVTLTNNVVSSVMDSYGGNELGTGANAASSASLPDTTSQKREK